MAHISDTNSITLSEDELIGAHLQAGDEVTIVADGRGRLIVERRTRSDRRAVPRSTPDRRSLATSADGEYPRDYLLVASSSRRRMRRDVA